MNVVNAKSGDVYHILEFDDGVIVASDEDWSFSISEEKGIMCVSCKDTGDAYTQFADNYSGPFSSITKTEILLIQALVNAHRAH
jgi:hypothetical protein